MDQGDPVASYLQVTGSRGCGQPRRCGLQLVSNQQQDGLLGVALTLFSWLSACSLAIVVATVIGAVVVDDPGRLERFIRTRGAEVPAARPPPTTPVHGELLDVALHPLRVSRAPWREIGCRRWLIPCPL